MKEKLQSTASDVQNREKTPVDSFVIMAKTHFFFFSRVVLGRKSHCSEAELTYSVYHISSCGLRSVLPGTGPIHQSHHQFLQSKAMQKMQLGLLS